MSVAVVKVVSLVEVFESMKHSLNQHSKMRAGIADLVLVVRDDDKGAVGSLDHQLLVAFFGETAVSHGHDLVDQVAVELDGHGDGKCQPGHHPGGVGADWLLKVASQLGEVLNEGDLVLDGLAVDTADEFEIIKARQLALKGPSKGQRPGKAHSSDDLTASRCFRSSDEANEGGLPGTIAPQKPDLLSPLDPEGDPVEHRTLPSPNGIFFRHFSEIDHVNSPQ